MYRSMTGRRRVEVAMPDTALWSDQAAREAFVACGRATLARIKDELGSASGVVAIEPESGKSRERPLPLDPP